MNVARSVPPSGGETSHGCVIFNGGSGGESQMTSRDTNNANFVCRSARSGCSPHHYISIASTAHHRPLPSSPPPTLPPRRRPNELLSSNLCGRDFPNEQKHSNAGPHPLDELSLSLESVLIGYQVVVHGPDGQWESVTRIMKLFRSLCSSEISLLPPRSCGSSYSVHVISTSTGSCSAGP